MTPTGTRPDSSRIHGVRRRLARWRQTRPHPRAPIPAAVWAAAVVVARQHGLYQTARALPISYSALKAHVERANRVDQEIQPPRFVELAPSGRASPPACVIEIDGPRGTLRIRLGGLALRDLVAVAQLWTEAS